MKRPSSCLFNLFLSALVVNIVLRATGITHLPWWLVIAAPAIVYILLILLVSAVITIQQILFLARLNRLWKKLGEDFEADMQRMKDDPTIHGAG